MRLARLIGVETHYTDGLGDAREVSDDTLSALIMAFGLPADPVSARHQLEEQRSEAAQVGVRVLGGFEEKVLNSFSVACFHAAY